MRKILIGCMVLLLLVLIGCQSEVVVQEQTTPTEDSVMPIKPTGEFVHVLILDEMFSPREVEIQVGDTVEWANKMDQDVSITFENGDFDERLASEGTITYTFLEEGEYGYFSILQPGVPGVRGVVTVVK